MCINKSFGQHQQTKSIHNLKKTKQENKKNLINEIRNRKDYFSLNNVIKTKNGKRVIFNISFRLKHSHGEL